MPRTVTIGDSEMNETVFFQRYHASQQEKQKYQDKMIAMYTYNTLYIM